MTYTYAILEISPAAYDEIAAKLKAAGYGHVFGSDSEMDMHGIALSRGPAPEGATADPDDDGTVYAASPAVNLEEWEVDLMSGAPEGARAEDLAQQFHEAYGDANEA